VALGKIDSSSKNDKIEFGFFSIRSIVCLESIPKSMYVQTICSLAYSSCSSYLKTVNFTKKKNTTTNLLNLEHVVVEELLKLLVGKVDAQLLKAVVLKDFESCNIQHTNEVCFSVSSQNTVQLLHDPQESALVDCLAHGISRRSY
jgi:hypothetical protein